MAEWFKATVLKTVIGKPIVSSNLTTSAQMLRFESCPLKAGPPWAEKLSGAIPYLKKTSNPSRASAHHVKQSKFEGSYRQKRAYILRTILKKSQTQKEIVKIASYEPKLLRKILSDLEKDGFIAQKSRRYSVL